MGRAPSPTSAANNTPGRGTTAYPTARAPIRSRAAPYTPARFARGNTLAPAGEPDARGWRHCFRAGARSDVATRTRASVGWFVVRVEERRQGPPPPYLTVKDELRNTLVREGMTAIAQAAVGEVTVHSFDIAGKDVQAEVGKHP